MKKNVGSQSIGAQMITKANGNDFTGSVSVLVTIDNGTQTAGGGTAPAHEGNGYHSYTPTQAETNGEHIAFTFTGTGALTATIQPSIDYPQTADHTAGIAAIPTTAMRGTDSAATAAAMSTAQSDLDKITGSDGATLATAQALYAPNKVVPDAAGVAPTAVEVRQEMDSNSVDLNSIIANQTAINDNVLLIDTAAMRGTDNAATSAKQDTMETTLNAIPTTAMRGTDGANTTTPDNAGISSNGAAIAALNNISIADVLTTAMTEAYAADGAAPTLTQAIMLIQQILTEFAVAGTSITVKKLDGSTTAAVMTLDDGTNPTSSTRSS
jgi:hypothetical protein